MNTKLHAITDANGRPLSFFITAGQVTVNGAPVTQLGTKIDPGRDRVSIAGKPVQTERKVYVALNKPTGYLCTSRDTHERRTVFDLLPEELPRLYTVGRLDCDTDGLLFLTNDGSFSLRLTHPRYKMPKTYRVEVDGELTAAQVTQLLKGVRSDGEMLRAEKVFDVQGSRLQLILREGKKRQVRRMLAAVGHPVTKLTRVAIGTDRATRPRRALPRERVLAIRTQYLLEQLQGPQRLRLE